MRNIFIIGLLFFAATSFSSSALAARDLIATYKSQDGEMLTIVTRDKQHVRMDTSETSYLLLQEEKVYSVSQDDTGEWQVMDMEQLKGMSSMGITSLFGGQKKTAEKEYSIQYEKTGTKEKIAGYTGILYDVEVKEGGKIVRRDQVVLSTHSDLKKINEAWAGIVAKMGDIMGDEMARAFETATKEAKKSGYGGMLRYGDEMKLHSLKKMSLDPSYYEIPLNAKHIELGQMPDLQQQQEYQTSQQKQQPEQKSEPQNQSDQTMEQDAKDVGQAARQETKDATIDEVKEGVRSLFKSIFD